MDLSKQYNDFAQKYANVHDEGDDTNRKVFYNHIDFVKSGMKLLDLGCGDGIDLAYYESLGAEIFGLDASEELIHIAKTRSPQADVRVGLFEDIPFESSCFDVVLSKYALQTSPDMSLAFKEIYRVLKPGGVMMYLVTHPLRQYFEKREISGDYFVQKIVDSNILNNTILVKEPSHTFNEYLSAFLLEHFDVKSFEECWDAAAEQIDGKRYPGYFILKAVKR